MVKLLEYLNSISPGPIADTATLEDLLANCWDQFLGSDEEGMAGYKLHQRMQDVEWKPPRLCFLIERHGATVLGSSRAERHEWILDIRAKTATYTRTGYKQIRPSDARLDIRPLAEEIVSLILNHSEEDRLKWCDDGSVRVRIGKIIPGDGVPRQTLEGRRKRFREEVDKRLGDAGWDRLGPNHYRPAQEDQP